MEYIDKDNKLLKVSANIVTKYAKLNKFHIDIENLVKMTPNDQDLGKKLRALLTDFTRFNNS